MFSTPYSVYFAYFDFAYPFFILLTVMNCRHAYYLYVSSEYECILPYVSSLHTS